MGADLFWDLFFRFLGDFSPTAESFGVSAQIGSGVVRGDPELRFHQGSTRGSLVAGSARLGGLR